MICMCEITIVTLLPERARRAASEGRGPGLQRPGGAECWPPVPRLGAVLARARCARLALCRADQTAHEHARSRGGLADWHPDA